MQSVRQGHDNVRVRYRYTRSGEQLEEMADCCVCCLPMAVLQRLFINLSSEMKEGVRTTEHSTAAKMGLQMRRRFWEEDDGAFGGHLWSRSLQLGEFSYPSNDYFSPKGVLLGFYGDGHLAGLAEQTVSARVEHVLARLS